MDDPVVSACIIIYWWSSTAIADCLCAYSLLFAPCFQGNWGIGSIWIIMGWMALGGAMPWWCPPPSHAVVANSSYRNRHVMEMRTTSFPCVCWSSMDFPGIDRSRKDAIRYPRRCAQVVRHGFCMGRKEPLPSQGQLRGMLQFIWQAWQLCHRAISGKCWNSGFPIANYYDCRRGPKNEWYHSYSWRWPDSAIMRESMTFLLRHIVDIWRWKNDNCFIPGCEQIVYETTILTIETGGIL